MAPEVKIAQVTNENQSFNGRLKRKRDEPNGHKSDKCRKNGSFCFYLRHPWVANIGFLKADCSELVFKNVLPARAGSTFV